MSGRSTVSLENTERPSAELSPDQAAEARGGSLMNAIGALAARLFTSRAESSKTKVYDFHNADSREEPNISTP